MSTPSYIPRTRTRWIPPEIRPKHDVCFFFHDEMARLLVEYELAGTNVLEIKFHDRKQARQFSKFAEKHDTIHAMRELGFTNEARRVIMNQITFAMVSDFLHHVYEALRCLEKRKFVVSLNLLRKPLQDSLPFIAWMVADEDSFYDDFTKVGPASLTAKAIGNKRKAVFERAIEIVDLNQITSATSIHSIVFDRGNAYGLYPLFQKAVHLVTAKYEEVATEPENFNFIFKSPMKDDLYFGIYDDLAELLLFASHLVFALFNRMRAADDGAGTAFRVRTIYAYLLAAGGFSAATATAGLNKSLASHLKCVECGASGHFTPQSALAAVTSERYFCAKCRRVGPFPFSWIF